MNKPSLRRLLPKDFNAELLEKLTNEGRVYIDLPRVNDKGMCKREILDYVCTINDYAAEVYSSGIAGIWESIVEDDNLFCFLTMKRGLQAGHVNRYAVTNIVYWLQNQGVYRHDVKMLRLHQVLEGISTKNSYYKSCGSYCLTREIRNILRQIISESLK